MFPWRLARMVLVLTVVCPMVKPEYRDTFVCRRTDDAKTESENVNIDERRIQKLEEKIAHLEEKIKEKPDFSPEVIHVQPPTVPPRDCLHIFENGEVRDGIYQISPDGRCPFNVYCDMTNGGWTVIQRRVTGNVNFRRSWNDYVTGFGDLDQDFWLGLDKIHRLTQSGSTIHFQLNRYKSKRPVLWALYNGFVVHDVISGYAMNVDTFGYNGTMEELFGYHDGSKFSTFDRDQDMHSASCSEDMGGGGGWWYKSCYRLGTLNGRYGEKNNGGVAFWNGDTHYVKDTQIKIKPLISMC